jgi:hypothetical protein
VAEDGPRRFRTPDARRRSALQGAIRIVAEDYAPLPSITFHLEGNAPRLVDGELRALGYLEYLVPGNAQVQVAWTDRPAFIGTTPVPSRAGSSRARRRGARRPARAQSAKARAE